MTGPEIPGNWHDDEGGVMTDSVAVAATALFADVLIAALR